MTKPNSAPNRTRKRIRNALASLLEEKKVLSNITITELVTRAGVSRSTFYTHYRNLRAVVADFQNEIFDNFFSSSAAQSLPTVDEYFTKLTDFLRTNEHIYRQLLASTEALEYEIILTDAICKQCFRLLQHNHNIRDVHNGSLEHLKIDINFFVNGFIGLLTKYFRGETDLTLEQIIDYARETIKFFLPQPRR